jgi:threonyl-tRNA synthetase
MRVEVDNGKARMQGKIREHRERHVPYMLIVGDKDMEAGAVSVRLRTDEDLGAMPRADFVAMAARLIESHSLELK